MNSTEFEEDFADGQYVLSKKQKMPMSDVAEIFMHPLIFREMRDHYHQFGFFDTATEEEFLRIVTKHFHVAYKIRVDREEKKKREEDIECE
jgi:hypothetical protein